MAQNIIKDSLNITGPIPGSTIVRDLCAVKSGAGGPFI